MSSLTLPIPNAHFIWYCAWLSVPSTIYALTHKSHHLAIVPATVFTTSLLYWRNPVRGSWYRVLDMTAVFLGVTYQSIYAFQTIRITSPNRHFAVYTSLIAASVACYALSNSLLSRGRLWPATYAHASIHLVANVANMVLYHENSAG
jgi:hypothetical protein